MATFQRTPLSNTTRLGKIAPEIWLTPITDLKPITDLNQLVCGAAWYKTMQNILNLEVLGLIFVEVFFLNFWSAALQDIVFNSLNWKNLEHEAYAPMLFRIAFDAID